MVAMARFSTLPNTILPRGKFSKLLKNPHDEW